MCTVSSTRGAERVRPGARGSRRGRLAGAVLAILLHSAPALGVAPGLAAEEVATQRGEPPASTSSPHASNQVVERIGRGDPELDRRIDEILQGGDYLLITDDTLIPASDTLPRTVLVLGGTLIVEGTILGDLAEVDANVFLRPSARVTGDLLNLGGGFYPSALAEVEGTVIDRPLAPYRVTRMGQTWIIEGISRVDRLVLDGFLGLHPPTYDRVNAVGLRWGASYLLSPSPDTLNQAMVHGWVGYLSGRGALEGGAELRRHFRGFTFAVGAAEETITYDSWIKGDLENSISFLWDGDDYRNYFLARRAYARLEQRIGSERRGLHLILRGQLEEDRSLHRVDTWTIFGGDESRPNPPIDEGKIAGITASVAGHWIGRKLAWVGGGALETAGSALGGNFSFNRFVLLGDFGMDAFANHALLLRWYFQGPLLGAERLPRQRWSILGGNGTLPAYDIGEFRGDRVAFVESRYVIPLPERWTIPILGRPDLEIAHAIGNAWTEGMDSDLIQSLEARVRFSFISLRIATDPVHPDDQFRASISLSSPFSNRFPWRFR